MIFEVELKRESFVVFRVEANNPDEAEAKGWKELERTNPCAVRAETWPREEEFWSVESIENMGGGA
jgi:hypothetical protein